MLLVNADTQLEEQLLKVVFLTKRLLRVETTDIGLTFVNDLF